MNSYVEDRGPQVRLVPLAVFTATYLIAAAVAAWVSGNQEFVIYLVIMVLLVAAIGAVHARVGFGAGVLWGLSLWGLAHMAGGLVRVPDQWPIDGEIRVLYSLWIIPGHLKYDQVVHAYGFGVATWACWQSLQATLSRRFRVRRATIQPSLGLLVLSATAAMGFGAMNEIIEFAATLLVPETNVGGYINTGWDLVANFTGATLAAVSIRLAQRAAYSS